MPVTFGGGATGNREGTLGMVNQGDDDFMGFRKGANSSKVSTGSIWRSSQPFVSSSPKERDHHAKIKKQNKDILFGQRPADGMKLTMGDRLRLFHYDHPGLSVAAAVTGILALSTALAVGTGYAIDALAHLTDRKNDKVGLVIGIVVGLIAALTQSIHLFGAVKRGQFHLNAGAFSPDTTKPDGQAWWLIVKRSPVQAAAMLRNAKSLKGYQHDNIVFLDTHVRDALELCQKYSLGKNVWSNSIEEHETLPFGEKRGYWRATASCEPLGIRKGYYYVSHHFSVNQLLEEEVRRQFDRHEHLRLNIAGVLITNIKANENGYIFNDSKNPIPNDSKAIERLQEDLHKMKYGQYGVVKEDLADGEQPEDVTKVEDFHEMLRVLGKELKKVSSYNDFMARVKNQDKGAMLANSYLSTLIIHKTKYKNDLSKSFVRVDEDTKNKPIFEGFRSASFYTWFVNLRDSVSAVLGSATDGVNQGATAGNQLFMFIPLTICASVVSVLLLGMTATPGGGKKPGNNNNGNQQANNGLNLGAYPAYQHGQAMLGTVSAQQYWGLTG